MGKSSAAPTVGYKNYAGATLVLAKMVHKVKQIKFGDFVAWKGSQESEGVISIDQPKLYGKAGTEGGFVGDIAFQPGLPDQMPDSYLLSVLGPDISASRGVSQFVLRRPYVGNNPYLKTMEVLCERVSVLDDGSEQWYLEKASISGAHSLANAFTEEFDYAGSLGLYTNRTTVFGGTAGGSIADFELVTDADFGTFCIKIKSGSPGTHPSIYRLLPSEAPLQYWSFKFKLKTRGLDDCGLIALRAADGSMVASFNFSRDSTVDADRRMSLAFVDMSGAPGTLFGPAGGVTIDNPYSVETTYDIATSTFNCVVTDMVTDTVYATASVVISGRLPIASCNFENDNFHDTAGTVLVDDVQVITESVTEDINPAHVLRECLTNVEWGFGYDDEDIDDDSFMAAADTLYNEGFGIGYLWDDDSTDLDGIMNKVTEIIDGNLYVDRSTLKWTLTLVRNDYDPDDLLELRKDYEVASISNYQRAEFLDLVNAVTVEFYNSAINGNGSITASDSALMLQQGARVGKTKYYDMCSNSGLAAILAQRELNIESQPLASCLVTANNAAKSLRRGSVFKLTSPRHNFNQTIMRVTQITRGDNTTKEIKIQCVQDRFAMPSASVVVPQPPVVTDPSSEPVPIVHRLAMEVPYAMLLAHETQTDIDAMLATSPDAGFAGIAAARVPGALSAELYLDAGAGYEDIENLDFCAYGELSAGIGYLDSSFTLTNHDDLDVIEDEVYFQIDNEIMAGLVDAATGVVSSVKRGIFDTVPAVHLANASVFFIENYLQGPETQYADGETVNIKLATKATLGTLNLAIAPIDSITMASRAIRPYPPGNLKLNSVAYAPTITGALTVTWAHRNRETQANAIIPTTQTSVTPKVNTRYTLEFYNASNVLLVSKSNIGPATADVVLNYTGNVTLKLWSVDDNGASLQHHEFVFAYTPPGGTVSSVITTTDYTHEDTTVIIDGGGA